jgi:hypothetical protein
MIFLNSSKFSKIISSIFSSLINTFDLIFLNLNSASVSSSCISFWTISSSIVSISVLSSSSSSLLLLELELHHPQPHHHHVDTVFVVDEKLQI